jgi:hypothetical protein
MYFLHKEVEFLSAGKLYLRFMRFLKWWHLYLQPRLKNYIIVKIQSGLRKQASAFSNTSPKRK